MIKIENTEVLGWDHAIRGMRNPKNSWDKSDSKLTVMNPGDVEFGYEPSYEYVVGENDLNLMRKLALGGPVHAKYRRMIVVYVDITAPLYWWKEFDTYKVGTVANSCSTMHKIHAKEFTIDDFSHEHLDDYNVRLMRGLVDRLNVNRLRFLETKDKVFWWQMIQLLPSSYNQKRTVMLNYEVLVNMYHSRKNHKLDEWHTFCDWVKTLPHSELIVGEDND